MRQAAWIIAIVVLLVTGFLGLTNGIGELGDWTTPLQMSVTLGVLLYGVLGAVAGIGLIFRRTWGAAVATAWAVVVTYVATVASFAYSDPTFSQSDTRSGVIGALVATALIGVSVVWAARVATRREEVSSRGV
jgi:hypothetical protein